MREIKVCFLSWHFQTPAIFLDYLRHMTPNRSGKWKNMTAITNPDEADFIVVFDGYNATKIDKSKTIYVGQHPYIGNGLSKSFRDFSEHNCLVRLSLDKFFNTGEWWINYSYDELMAMKVTDAPKTKETFCATTYQIHNTMYAQRPKFMAKFFETYPNADVDLYGRPEERFHNDPILSKYYKGALGFNKPDGTKGEHTVGKEILKNYRYSIEFDVGPTKNYFSERFYDSLLLWCMPIYYGSNNVHEIIPAEAFHYVNIDDLSDVNRVMNIISSDSRERNLEAITHARDLLLNNYQTFPYIYDVINNLDKYKVTI